MRGNTPLAAQEPVSATGRTSRESPDPSDHPLHRVCSGRTASMAALCLLILMIGLSSRLTLQAQPAPEPADQSLADVIVRDRTWHVLLSTAAKAIEQQRFSDAAELLQKVFDAPEDGFVLRSDWPKASARGNAVYLLRTAGERAWIEYERLFGVPARNALEVADQIRTAPAYYGVIRRFEHTQAGGRAMDRLANLQFDRGEVGTAIGTWNQLFDNPVHAPRVTSVQRMKMLTAAQRVGRRDLVERELTALGPAQVSLRGQLMTGRQWLQLLERNGGTPVRPADAEYPLLGGNPERNRPENASAPYLRASFTGSLFDPGVRELTSVDEQLLLAEGRRQVEEDLENADANAHASGFGGTPIVVGDLVIWRDVIGITAIDRLTMQTVWSFRTGTPLHSLLRFTSDLQARNVGQNVYSRASVFEQLSSDGQHLFFIDRSFFPEPETRVRTFGVRPGAAARDRSVPQHPWNTLAAVTLRSVEDKGRVAWSLGGDPIKEPDAPLSGYFFLGPPVPSAGLLYVVAEVQRATQLLAIDPATGRPVWRQTLSFVPQASRDMVELIDRRRLAPATFVAAGNGRIVCPLSSGVIVTVNQLTGEVEWVHDFRARVRRPGGLGVPLMNFATEIAEEADFLSTPLIKDQQVYVLTPGENTAADQVICFDLETGKPLWQTPTPDLKYLGYVDERRLIGVGASEVMGLDIETGKVVWSRRLTRISGVGTVAGEMFLIPLADGRVYAVKLEDGAEAAFSMRSPNQRPGNLVICDQSIVSINGLDVQVYPQASSLLAKLEAAPAASRKTFEYLTELGELQFRTGQVQAARDNLNAALQLEAPAPAKSVLREILRDLIAHRLQEPGVDRLTLLGEYGTLCETDSQEAQYLLMVSEEQARTGDLTSARKTLSKLLHLRHEGTLQSLTEPDRRLSVATWAVKLSRLAQAHGQNPDELLGPEWDPASLMAQGQLDTAALFLLLHADASWAPAQRLKLAEEYVREGRPQAAELQVWEDHLGTSSAAVDACLFLLELWSASSLYEESGHLLHRLQTDLADVRGLNGKTGAECAAEWPADSLAWVHEKRLRPLDWAVQRVRIDEHHEVNPSLRGTYSVAPRTAFVPRSSQQFVGRNNAGAANGLQQVDVETGQVIAQINLPFGIAPGLLALFESRNRVGHYLPMATKGVSYGLSLLERGVTWSIEHSPEFRLNSYVRIGPCTPQLSIMRSRDRLFAVNQSTGQLLWERETQEDGQRLSFNSFTAIPGDSEVVLLNETDGRNYQVFRTVDGSFVRAGRLDDCFFIQQHYGRNILYALDAAPMQPQMRNIRLWDSLEDRVLFEARDLAAAVGVSEREQEFTVVDKTGLARVVDGQTGAVKLQVQLNPADINGDLQAPQIKAFTDGTRYYLNVNRQSPQIEQFPADVIFPNQMITGDLYAIDPETSQIIWSKQKLSPQNVVYLADYRLPFLVTLSRVRPRLTGNTPTYLRIDVWDGQTGEMLASRPRAFNDRMLLSDYDRDAGRLRFRGMTTQIELHFNREVNRILSPLDDLVTAPLTRP